MEVYVRDNSSKNKLKEGQGLLAAVSDIEGLPNGREALLTDQRTNNPRLRFEKGVLCQASNRENSWQSKGRFVWAMSADGSKALLEGYVSDHVGGKYNTAYENLKRAAAKRTDKDFDGAIRLSSAEIMAEQTKAIARQVTKPIPFDWMADLRKDFQGWQELAPDDAVLAQNGFEDSVHVLRREHPELFSAGNGFLRDKEWHKIIGLPKEDPFRVAMEQIKAKTQQRALGEQALETKSAEKPVEKTQKQLLTEASAGVIPLKTYAQKESVVVPLPRQEETVISVGELAARKYNGGR